MEMIHGLTTCWADVGHQAVTTLLRKPQAGRKLHGKAHHLAQHHFPGISRSCGCGIQMLPWYDQNMDRGLGVDIMKGIDLL